MLRSKELNITYDQLWLVRVISYYLIWITATNQQKSYI